MQKIISIIMLTLLASVANAKPIVDVTKIAGKTQKSVVAYLGKEISCSKSKYGNKCLFKKGDTEIVFINGKADWITVEGIDNVSFSKSALSALGLKIRKPTFKSNFTLKWEPIQGMRSVSIFKGASKSDYAYIKVKTK